MQTVPAKNYIPLSGLSQPYLPMDVGVLILQNDSVRLLVFALKQLNVKPLYEAYTAYGEKRRRENPPSMADFPVGSFGFAKTPPARRWRTALETAASMPREREAAECSAGKLPANMILKRNHSKTEFSE
jgi:hypothetical protein